MFRKMRRFGQELSAKDCRALLKRAKRGVLSVQGDDGYPYGVPVNYSYDEETDTIYIHGAKEGHKIDAIRHCSKVSFTAWEQGELDADGWSWHMTSVIAFGEAELVEDLALTTEKVRELGLKYSPSPEEVEADIRSAIHRVQLIAVHIQHLTGKRVHER